MPHMSNYPQGFNAVSIRGVPLALAHPGKVFFVNSTAVLPEDGVSGADTPSAGTYHRPFATLDYAIGQCTASRNDVIFLMPGHSETLATAGAIAVDVDGISIVGLGQGADRPTFTFSDTASTMTVSGNDVSIENIITTPSIDSVVSPIVVSGANVNLDYEHQDASSAIEAVRAILTTAAADGLNVKLKYTGFAAGNACVNAIRLVGGNNVAVDIDFHGVASTSVVEFHTTACTNVVVKGYVFNSGTTDGSKLVVDTVTGSTWFATINDGAAGASYSGGSAAALASDDISAVSSLIGTIDSAVTSDLHGKLGTDTEMADRSVYDLINGGGPAAAATAAAAANDVSLYAVTRYLSELQVPRTVLKSTGDLTAFGTSKNLFTVTGDVMVQVFASVDVAVTSTSGTTTLSVGVAGKTAGLIAADTVDNTAFDIGDSWAYGFAADTNAGLIDTGWAIVGNSATIILTGSVDDITAGDIDFYCRYIPLTSGSSVVAA